LVPRGTQKSRPCGARHPFSLCLQRRCHADPAGRRGSPSSAFGIAIGVEVSALPAPPVPARSRATATIRHGDRPETSQPRSCRRARWSRHRRDRTAGSAIASAGDQAGCRASPGRRGLPLSLQAERSLDRGAVLFRKQRGGLRVNPVSVETNTHEPSRRSDFCQSGRRDQVLAYDWAAEWRDPGRQCRRCGRRKASVQTGGSGFNGEFRWLNHPQWLARR
jgi:hypothetical protein